MLRRLTPRYPPRSSARRSIPGTIRSSSWATQANRSCSNGWQPYSMMHQHELEQQGYLKDVDIFQDLSPEEVDAIGKRAPMRTVEAGTIFYSPEEASEVLFILKAGRVRL